MSKTILLHFALLCTALLSLGCSQKSAPMETAADAVAAQSDIEAVDAISKHIGADAAVGDSAGDDASSDIAELDTQADTQQLSADTGVSATKKPCGGQCPSGQKCDFAKDICVNECAIPTGPPKPAGHIVVDMVVLPKGQGCDLNGDGAPDNRMSKVYDIYPALDDFFADTLQGAELDWLLLPESWGAQPFAIQSVLGHASSKTCKKNKTGDCSFCVDPNNYDTDSTAAKCPSHGRFIDATVKSGKLAAQTPPTGLPLLVEYDPSVVGPIIVPLFKARLKGDVGTATTWAAGKVTLCGAISCDALVNAPGGPATTVGILKSMLCGGTFTADLDLSGNGVNDAMSMAVELTTVPATVLGTCAP